MKESDWKEIISHATALNRLIQMGPSWILLINMPTLRGKENLRQKLQVGDQAGDTKVKWKSPTEQCSLDYLLTLQSFFNLFSGQACRQSWNIHRMMHHHVLHTTLLTDTFSSFYGSFYYYVHKPFSLYTAQNKSWITTRNLKAEYAWSMNIPIWFQNLLAFKKKERLYPKCHNHWSK